MRFMSITVRVGSLRAALQTQGQFRRQRGRKPCGNDIVAPKPGRVIKKSRCARIPPLLEFRVLLSFFTQLPQLLAHTPVSPNYGAQIKNMNYPGRSIRGIHELDRIHCALRFASTLPRGTLTFTGCADNPPAPARDSSAWAAS